MKRKQRRPILTQNLSVRLSAPEMLRVKEGAEELGIGQGEFARKLLADALRPVSDSTRVLLAELCGMRFIMLRLNDDLAHGKPLTAARLIEIVKEADAAKHAMAERRIRDSALGGEETVN